MAMQEAIATTMTQPLDVLKIRSMNAKPGEFGNSLGLIKYTAKNGPMAFYKVGLHNMYLKYFPSIC